MKEQGKTGGPQLRALHLPHHLPSTAQNGSLRIRTLFPPPINTYGLNVEQVIVSMFAARVDKGDLEASALRTRLPGSIPLASGSTQRARSFQSRLRDCALSNGGEMRVWLPKAQPVFMNSPCWSHDQEEAWQQVTCPTSRKWKPRQDAAHRTFVEEGTLDK